MRPILVADDNASICDILSDYIKNEGYPALTASTGEDAVRVFLENRPCLVLLDVMLPDIDGLEVLRRIREVSQTPVLLVTARGEDSQRISGLDSGADDYIVKPFSPGEVMARVRSALRRTPPEGSDETLCAGGLAIDLPKQSATLNGAPLTLTRKELELLWTLCSQPGRVFTRDNLLTMVWGYEHMGNDRAVDTHIKRLRAKLDERPHPAFAIKTVWGVGYTLEVKSA